MTEDPIPEGFAALTARSKQEYERRFLTGARNHLENHYATRASFETIELRGEGLGVELVVLFRLLDRPDPDRLYGYRTPIWPSGPFDEECDPSDNEEEDDDMVAKTPEQDGSWTVMLSLGEDIESGLGPLEPAANGPTWLPTGPYPWT
jgi:hypothetical protein